MTLPFLDLHGTPYEQGVQHGRQLRDQIERNLALYYARFEREAGLSRLDVLQRAMRYGAEMGHINADYMQGLLGIADGSGVHLTEIIVLNVRYEILYDALSSAYTTDGCTIFAIEPARSQDNRLYIGQNWDWFPEIECTLIRTTAQDGLKTLVFSEAGIFGGKAGFNSAGVGLAINGLYSDGDDWSRLHKPFHVRCYEVLQQRHFDAATAIITAEARSCSANFLIAQAPDRIVNLETAPDEVFAQGCRSGFVAHTNHFINKDAPASTMQEKTGRSFTKHRYSRIQALLAQKKLLALADLQAFLSDQDGYPNAVCQHIDYDDPPEQRYVTIVSMIMDLTTLTLYVSDGPPDVNPYEMVTLA